MKSSTGRNLLIGCGAIVSLLVLCGCAAVLINVLGQAAGMPSIVATVPPATETVAIAEPTSAPVAEATDEPTLGLGATQAALEGQLADDFIAYFANDRAWYVERQSRTGLDLEAELAALIPTDSVQVDTYPIADGDRTARVYTSAWLAGQFGDDQWGGEQPGTFMVTFNSSEPITRIVVATGNEP